jgi:hypothetical protein
MTSDERDPDLSAWEAQEPSAGFAERVVNRVTVSRESERPPRRARARWVAAAVVLCAVAAGVMVFVSRPADKGDIRADVRREVQMGGRVVAVLEPGAHVQWDGDRVTQDEGEIFYRVERGAPLVVHTAAGDATVLGTCFSVNVKGTTMIGRDAKSGIVGGVISALALVGVYEGKVAVSHASSSLTLTAGESAKLDDHGVSRTGDLAEGEHAFDQPSLTDPLMTANANLTDSVRDYKNRLQALEAEKDKLKKQLSSAEDKLASTQDGAAAPRKNAFDLSPDDWTDLAKTGTVKYQVPCFAKQRTAVQSPTSFDLDKLGLAPSDVPTLQAAYGKSRDRMWGIIIPLCAQAVGMEVAEKLGPNSCIHVIVDVARANDPKATNEAMYQVGEIRSGQRPWPGPNDNVSPVVKMFLALTGETKSFEGDLAQSFGPDEAHRLAYSRDGMCIGTSEFGGPGPRESK